MKNILTLENKLMNQNQLKMKIRIGIAFFLCIVVIFAYKSVSRWDIPSPSKKFFPQQNTKFDTTNKVNKLSNKNFDTTLTIISELLAALPLSDSSKYPFLIKENTKNHYVTFEKAWQNLETQKLKKMRKWRDNELQELNKVPHNLFYPFSGPDFLNAYLLFPHCDNYLMFGLEKTGELPKINQLKGAYLQNYLTSLRFALSEIFQRNYFITSRMSGALNSNVKGILPIIAVFLARTENQIIRIQKVYIEKTGKFGFTSLTDQSKHQLLNGICVEFQNTQKDKSQFLYYFSTDLSDGAMPSKPELSKFVKDFPDKITFIKSASYLLHTGNFTTIRNLVLQESDACVQDDTGVPYKYFSEKTWQVQLYGKYAPPIRDFNHGYQADLNDRFLKDKNIKPIDFTFGYHWWTDKSSILYFKKMK